MNYILVVTAQLPCEQRQPAVAGLTRTLYGDRFDQVHAPWRELFASVPFQFHEGLTRDQRISLSYERLRLVGKVVGDPVGIVQDVEHLAALNEWAGPADPGLVILASIHFNLFLGSLSDHDTPQMRDFSAMSRIGTFLCTEVGHGNSASQLETTATYDPARQTFVLNTPSESAAKFMPNTSSDGGPKSAVVAARLRVAGRDEGVFLFLAPLHDADMNPMPGVDIRRLPQTASSPMDHCLTAFRNVELPYEAMLQADHGRLTREGEFTSPIGNKRKRFLKSIGRVSPGKLCMSAYSIGVTRHALTVAVRHAYSRHTVGIAAGSTVPLVAYRSHHAPLLDGLAATYAAILLHRVAVQRWVEAEAADSDREDAERFIAMVKGWVTRVGRSVMTECRERCGARGLFLANGIAGQLAANEGAITAEGDNQVIWAKAAGELLLGNFVPIEPNDVPAEKRDLHDSRDLRDLLGSVENIWYQRARIRLRTARGAGGPLHRLNNAMPSALKLVDAHVHRLAADALAHAADEATDHETGNLLGKLHRLFSLKYVNQHSGDLLADGYVTADQVRSIPDLTEALIEALMPHLPTLTSGLAVGDENSPAGPSPWSL